MTGVGVSFLKWASCCAQGRSSPRVGSGQFYALLRHRHLTEDTGLHPSEHAVSRDTLHGLDGVSLLSFFLLFFFGFSRAPPVAYGGSQTRSLIAAVAVSLRQSHSNAGSELCLRPTPQLTAALDPSPTERGQGSNPQPHGS